VGGGGRLRRNKSDNLSVDVELNPVPRSYLSTSRSRDTATINYLTTNVATRSGTVAGHEPERQYGPAAATAGAVPAVHGRPKPRARRHQPCYNGLQGRLEKRFTSGYTVLVSYTWSKFTEQVSLLMHRRVVRGASRPTPICRTG